MKRFQTMLFVLAAVGSALVAMLVLGLALGADDNSSSPSDRPEPAQAEHSSTNST